MSKIFIILLVSIIAFSIAKPNHKRKEVKEELMAAGISEAAAKQLIKIGKAYEADFKAAGEDKAKVTALFEKIQPEVDTYLATQTESDRNGYKVFVQKIIGSL